MHSNDPCYRYIKAPLSTSLITLLKFLLVLIRANPLYPMPIDLAPHMPQLPFNTMIDKYHHYISKHFILTLVPVIIFHLIFTKEDDLGILCQG